MTYVNELDASKPAFDDPVGRGDDQIRALKAGLIERFATIVEDVAADPWVLKATALIRTTTPRQISHQQFQARDDATSVSRGVSSLSPRTHASSTFYGEVIVPDGVQVVNAIVRIGSFHANATAAGTLYRAFDGGGPDAIAAFAITNNAGWVTNVGSDLGLPVNVQAGDRFIFVITLDTTTATNVNDAQLAWAQLLVNAPAI